MASVTVGIWLMGCSELDPEPITQSLQMEPTRIWRCRPEVAAQQPELDRVSWIFETTDVSEIDYSNALGQVVQPFWSRRNELKALSNQLQLAVSFHLVPQGEARSFVTNISADLISKMADLNAELVIHNDRLEA